MTTQPKWMTWVGWGITLLMAGTLCFSAAMKFLNPPELANEIAKFGFPDGVMFYVGIVEVTCAVLYLIPPTAVLGAVLLTGYLGGAVVTHVRIEDNFASPIIVGLLVWLAIFLREPRLRQLLPVRRAGIKE